MNDSPGPSPRRSNVLLWIVAGGGALLAVLVLAVALTRSQTGSAAPGEISPARLNGELASIIYLQKLAQGFDFHVHVVCQPNQGDLLHFACGVEATTAGRPPVFWTEFVTCAGPGEARAQRCQTASGYSLQ